MRHNRRHPAYGFQHGDCPRGLAWRIIFVLVAIFWIMVIWWFTR